MLMLKPKPMQFEWYARDFHEAYNATQCQNSKTPCQLPYFNVRGPP